MNSPTSSLTWTLRYLICYAGVAGAQRLDTLRRTSFDAVHGMQAYLCASKEEWDLLGKTLVCKVNKRLLQAVELFCEATGERKKLTGAEVFGILDAGSLMLDAGLPETGGPKVEFVLECIEATLRHYAGLPVTQENLQECVDRIANAVREGGLPAKSAGPAGEPKAESFYERLLGEHEQLEDRLNKLETFIGESPIFAGLPALDQELLQEQYKLMHKYQGVLNARIMRVLSMAEGSRSGGVVEAPVEPEAALSTNGDGGEDAPGGGGPGSETQSLGEGSADSGEAARGVVAAESGEDGRKEAQEPEKKTGVGDQNQSRLQVGAPSKAPKKPAAKKKK